MPFNPDEYLAKKAAFDPDAYLSGKTAAPAKESSFIDKFIPSGDASLGENVDAGLDTIKSLGTDAANGMNALAENINPLAPIAHGAANLARTAANHLVGDGTKSYADYRDEDNANTEAASKESPIATGVAGAVGALANPVNKLGVGAGVVANATNSVLRSGIQDQKIESLGDTGSQAGNLLENAAIEGGLGKGLQLAGKSISPEMYEQLALKFGKKTLGGTKKQLEKLDVRSDKLDQSVKQLLSEGIFDEPFQTKKELFDKVAAAKRQSGEAGGDLFTATAKPANQAETYERLMTRAKVARNKGQSEIANKLESEAKVIKDIESTPLGIEQPITSSPDQAKSIDMQNTELDPEIIKNRKTTLDEQAFKGEGDPAARAAADELRDTQYGLMDPDAQDFLREENKRYGNLATADKLASANAAGEISSGGGITGGLKKGMLSATGGVIGNAMFPGGYGASGGMMAGAYASNLLRQHGNQLAAYGFNKASKVLQNEQWAKTLSDAAQRGGTQGVSTAHFLLTQRDPAYRKAHQEDQDASKDQ